MQTTNSGMLQHKHIIYQLRWTICILKIGCNIPQNRNSTAHDKTKARKWSWSGGGLIRMRILKLWLGDLRLSINTASAHPNTTFISSANTDSDQIPNIKSSLRSSTCKFNKPSQSSASPLWHLLIRQLVHHPFIIHHQPRQPRPPLSRQATFAEALEGHPHFAVPQPIPMARVEPPVLLPSPHATQF